MKDKTVIRLTSAPMIHAPGMWRWAVAMYRTSPEQIIKVMSSWPHPKWTRDNIIKALTGKVPVRISEDYVEVTI